jgi:hypothetical protein
MTAKRIHFNKEARWKKIVEDKDGLLKLKRDVKSKIHCLWLKKSSLTLTPAGNNTPPP